MKSFGWRKRLREKIKNVSTEKLLRLKNLLEAKGLASPNPQGSETGKSKMSKKLIERIWTRNYINNLPDAAFALILLGGEKDEEGKTTPRTLRKFPHHRADGSIDLPHLRNANSRVGVALENPERRGELTVEQLEKAKAHLDRHKKAAGIGEFAEEAKEPFQHGWPILKGQAEEEEVEEVEFEIAPEPTMDELIESIEDIVEGINQALDALVSRVEALEGGKAQEQQGGPPKAGVPKTDKERLIAHFGEDKATKLLDLIGEEAYKLLPPVGTKRAQEQQGKPGTSEESVKGLKEIIGSLKGQIKILEDQKNTLQEELEKAKKQTGEAIIPSTVTPPPDMIPKKAIEAVLPPDWIAHAWGLGPQRFVQDIKKVLRSSK